MTRLVRMETLRIAMLSAAICAGSPLRAEDFPDVSQLKPVAELPDPLLMFDGQKVTSRDQWISKRRPELIGLFQHYMYGRPPAAPRTIEPTIERVDTKYFGGKATKKEVTIAFGPPDVPTIHLLVVVPNQPAGTRPVFLGINFCGNHTLLDDPLIALPAAWMPDSCAGCRDHQATDAGRGSQQDVWAVEQIIDRGYALACFYCGDVDPDKNDFSDGVHPFYAAKGQMARNPHDWGTIAAWAWGMQRAVDYLVTDPAIDKSRIAVVGHSRLGKTSLLAGALDERIALIIPHQAGCGGTAPSRHKVGEQVKQINERFPHWFCDEFKNFNDDVERLPFDQHCLVALCAPRPVLLSNAQEDTWADPDGQFRVLQGADPVYKLLGSRGLDGQALPEPDRLLDTPLGYYIRPGKHSMTAGDWKVFLDFADKYLGAKPAK
jgi:(4-O-methyl)-D-glucuronate---lignin esterase